MKPPNNLLYPQDWTTKIDFHGTENFSPFDFMFKITPIALQKANEYEEPLTATSCTNTTSNPASTSTTMVLALRDDSNNQTLPQRLRDWLDENLGGKDAKLMVTKKLFKSDVNPAEGRFAVPLKQLLSGVLTEEEEEKMKAREGGGNKVVGMKVKLVDPSLKVREITFKIWSMPKKNGTVSCSCVLTAPWNDVVKENRLVEGDGVQLWGFRMDGELGLGLFRVDGEGRVCCP